RCADLNPEQPRADVIDLREVGRALHACHLREDARKVFAHGRLTEQRNVAGLETDVLVDDRADEPKRVAGAVLLPDIDSAEAGLHEEIGALDGIVVVIVARQIIMIEQEVAARAQHHARVQSPLYTDVPLQRGGHAAAVFSPGNSWTRARRRREQRTCGGSPET